MKKFIVLALLVLIGFSSCAPRVVRTQPVEKIVVVQTLPKNHKVVYIRGKRYYKWNGKHYRKSNRGYVAVKIRTI